MSRKETTNVKKYIWTVEEKIPLWTGETHYFYIKRVATHFSSLVELMWTDQPSLKRKVNGIPYFLQPGAVVGARHVLRSKYESDARTLEEFIEEFPEVMIECML